MVVCCIAQIFFCNFTMYAGAATRATYGCGYDATVGGGIMKAAAPDTVDVSCAAELRQERRILEFQGCLAGCFRYTATRGYYGANRCCNGAAWASTGRL